MLWDGLWVTKLLSPCLSQARSLVVFGLGLAMARVEPMCGHEARARVGFGLCQGSRLTATI